MSVTGAQAYTVVTVWSVAHGERALTWLTGAVACAPIVSPCNTALAGTNFGSEPTLIKGRPSARGPGQDLCCHVACACVYVVLVADNNVG
jgi:hypothetical protein